MAKENIDYTQLPESELVTRNRISENTEWVFVFVAWICEGISFALEYILGWLGFGLLLQWIFDMGAYAFFILKFYQKGIKLFRVDFSKYIKLLITRLLFDVIPGANLVFIIFSTVSNAPKGQGPKAPLVSFVSRIIGETRAEDEEHNIRINEELGRRMLERGEEDAETQALMQTKTNYVGGEIRQSNVENKEVLQSQN